MSIKDRTFGGGGGVCVGDVRSLGAGSSGRHTGLFALSEFN
jgi:hypothetical protein